ncbi:unknown [Firmicutes bacterium CAG:791]|nr:unknown [Firmicutes bacterium CAG:791]
MREQAQQLCPEQNDRTGAAVLPKAVYESRGQGCCVFFSGKKSTDMYNKLCV